MRVFLSRPFWILFFKKRKFCFISMKTSSLFIWDIIYFCNISGFFRILEKTLSELICTRLYKVMDKGNKLKFEILDNWKKELFSTKWRILKQFISKRVLKHQFKKLKLVILWYFYHCIITELTQTIYNRYHYWLVFCSGFFYFKFTKIIFSSYKKGGKKSAEKELLFHFYDRYIFQIMKLAAKREVLLRHLPL